jgi:hypothetical protein
MLGLKHLCRNCLIASIMAKLAFSYQMPLLSARAVCELCGWKGERYYVEKRLGFEWFMLRWIYLNLLFLSAH